MTKKTKAVRRPFRRNTIITGIPGRSAMEALVDLLEEAGYEQAYVDVSSSYLAVDADEGGEVCYTPSDPEKKQRSYDRVPWRRARAILTGALPAEVVPGFAHYRAVPESGRGGVMLGCQRGTRREVELIYEACAKARRAKRPVESPGLSFGTIEVCRITSTGGVVAHLESRPEPFAGVEAMYNLVRKRLKPTKP